MAPFYEGADLRIDGLRDSLNSYSPKSTTVVNSSVRDAAACLDLATKHGPTPHGDSIDFGPSVGSQLNLSIPLVDYAKALPYLGQMRKAYSEAPVCAACEFRKLLRAPIAGADVHRAFGHVNAECKLSDWSTIPGLQITVSDGTTFYKLRKLRKTSRLTKEFFLQKYRPVLHGMYSWKARAIKGAQLAYYTRGRSASVANFTLLSHMLYYITSGYFARMGAFGAVAHVLMLFSSMYEAIKGVYASAYRTHGFTALNDYNLVASVQRVYQNNRSMSNILAFSQEMTAALRMSPHPDSLSDHAMARDKMHLTHESMYPYLIGTPSLKFVAVTKKTVALVTGDACTFFPLTDLINFNAQIGQMNALFMTIGSDHPSHVEMRGLFEKHMSLMSEISRVTDRKDMREIFSHAVSSFPDAVYSSRANFLTPGLANGLHTAAIRKMTERGGVYLGNLFESTIMEFSRSAEGTELSRGLTRSYGWPTISLYKTLSKSKLRSIVSECPRPDCGCCVVKDALSVGESRCSAMTFLLLRESLRRHGKYPRVFIMPSLTDSRVKHALESGVALPSMNCHNSAVSLFSKIKIREQMEDLVMPETILDVVKEKAMAEPASRMIGRYGRKDRIKAKPLEEQIYMKIITDNTLNVSKRMIIETIAPQLLSADAAEASGYDIATMIVEIEAKNTLTGLPARAAVLHLTPKERDVSPKGRLFGTMTIEARVLCAVANITAKRFISKCEVSSMGDGESNLQRVISGVHAQVLSSRGSRTLISQTADFSGWCSQATVAVDHDALVQLNAYFGTTLFLKASYLFYVSHFALNCPGGKALVSNMTPMEKEASYAKVRDGTDHKELQCLLVDGFTVFRGNRGVEGILQSVWEVHSIAECVFVYALNYVGPLYIFINGDNLTLVAGASGCHDRLTAEGNVRCVVNQFSANFTLIQQLFGRKLNFEEFYGAKNSLIWSQREYENGIERPFRLKAVLNARPTLDELDSSLFRKIELMSEAVHGLYERSPLKFEAFALYAASALSLPIIPSGDKVYSHLMAPELVGGACRLDLSSLSYFGAEDKLGAHLRLAMGYLEDDIMPMFRLYNIVPEKLTCSELIKNPLMVKNHSSLNAVSASISVAVKQTLDMCLIPIPLRELLLNDLTEEKALQIILRCGLEGNLVIPNLLAMGYEESGEAEAEKALKKLSDAKTLLQATLITCEREEDIITEVATKTSRLAGLPALNEKFKAVREAEEGQHWDGDLV